MKGYEGCYDCKYEAQEEGAGEHSKKITYREEEGRQVEAMSCTHVAVGGDGTGRQIDTTLQKKGVRDMKKRDKLLQNKTKKKANSTIMTEVTMSVTDAETLKQQHCLWL